MSKDHVKCNDGKHIAFFVLVISGDHYYVKMVKTKVKSFKPKHIDKAKKEIEEKECGKGTGCQMSDKQQFLQTIGKDRGRILIEEFRYTGKMT